MTKVRAIILPDANMKQKGKLNLTLDSMWVIRASASELAQMTQVKSKAACKGMVSRTILHFKVAQMIACNLY